MLPCGMACSHALSHHPTGCCCSVTSSQCLQHVSGSTAPTARQPLAAPTAAPRRTRSLRQLRGSCRPTGTRRLHCSRPWLQPTCQPSCTRCASGIHPEGALTSFVLAAVSFVWCTSTLLFTNNRNAHIARCVSPQHSHSIHLNNKSLVPVDSHLLTPAHTNRHPYT